MTFVIQIGNTDNKLSQQEWHKFALGVHDLVNLYSTQIHFHGGPPTVSPYQNFAIIFDIMEISIELIKTELTNLRKYFKQDSIAITIGTTEFI